MSCKCASGIGDVGCVSALATEECPAVARQREEKRVDEEAKNGGLMRAAFPLFFDLTTHHQAGLYPSKNLAMSLFPAQVSLWHPCTLTTFFLAQDSQVRYLIILEMRL